MIDSISIDTLEDALSVRAFQTVKRSGIDTIGKLLKLSENDIKSIRLIGRKCPYEVMELLNIIRSYQAYNCLAESPHTRLGVKGLGARYS